MPALSRQVTPWSIALLLALAGVINVLRFTGLETSPPGFHSDEAIVATETIAIRETGRGSDGHSRVFVPAGPPGAGYDSPTHLYPKAAWLGVAGYSIKALRAYAGLEAMLLLTGLFFLARLRFGLSGGLFALLAGSLSPWIFQFSRLAVDDPMLALAGMVWGMYFFLRSARITDALLAAACFSVAAYAYAAARIVLPPLYFFLWWTVRAQRRITWGDYAAFFLTGVVLCLPLIVATLNGTLMSRHSAVGIFGAEYRQQANLTNLPEILGVFARNLALHFSPTYLLASGDANLRHSTQRVGELSWLDAAALAAGVVLLATRFLRGPRAPVDRFLVTCAAGVFIGVIPAALTWEGLPNSVRGCASWIFFALLTAGILAGLERRWKWTMPVALAISLAFAGRFFPDYFKAYPARAATPFDTPLRQAAERARDTGDWNEFDGLARSYPAGVASFHRIAYAEGRRLGMVSLTVRESVIPVEFEGLTVKAHAPSRLAAPVPARAQAIRGGFGIFDGAFAKPAPDVTDGADFLITHLATDGTRTVLLRRHLDPVHAPGDRGLQKFELALPFGGQIEFATTPGPDGSHNAFDWTYWQQLEFTAAKP